MRTRPHPGKTSYRMFFYPEDVYPDVVFLNPRPESQQAAHEAAKQLFADRAQATFAHLDELHFAEDDTPFSYQSVATYWRDQQIPGTCFYQRSGVNEAVPYHVQGTQPKEPR